MTGEALFVTLTPTFGPTALAILVMIALLAVQYQVAKTKAAFTLRMSMVGSVRESGVNV